MSPVRRVPLAALAAVLVAVLGCEGGATTEAALSWRFSDGRPCDLAGVQTVVILGGGEEIGRAQCADGLAPAGPVEVPLAVPAEEIVLEGRSLSFALLYRGVARLETGAARPQTVTLRFVGGG